MKKYEQEDKVPNNMVNEEAPVYKTREGIEDARLRAAMNKTDTEKFYLFTTMVRINRMMSSAKITHTLSRAIFFLMDIPDEDLVHFWSVLNKYNCTIYNGWQICC
jgi:hypothetical protein